MESVEAQDVREAKDTDQEEAEEMSFVPSASSAPRRHLFCCDNQCSEKTFRFWQIASVVIKEFEEPYTTNLCRKCYNESLKARRRKLTDKLAVERVFGEKGAPWNASEIDGKRTIRMLGKEKEYYDFERRPKKEGKQEYRVSGSWNRQPKSTCSKLNTAMTLTARTE